MAKLPIKYNTENGETELEKVKLEEVDFSEITTEFTEVIQAETRDDELYPNLHSMALDRVLISEIQNGITQLPKRTNTGRLWGIGSTVSTLFASYDSDGYTNPLEFGTIMATGGISIEADRLAETTPKSAIYNSFDCQVEGQYRISAQCFIEMNFIPDNNTDYLDIMAQTQVLGLCIFRNGVFYSMIAQDKATWGKYTFGEPTSWNYVTAFGVDKSGNKIQSKMTIDKCFNFYLSGSDIVNLNAGDVIDLRIFTRPFEWVVYPKFSERNPIHGQIALDIVSCEHKDYYPSLSYTNNLEGTTP